MHKKRQGDAVMLWFQLKPESYGIIELSEAKKSQKHRGKTCCGQRAFKLGERRRFLFSNKS
jgi:hypothetical protein